MYSYSYSILRGTNLENDVFLTKRGLSVSWKKICCNGIRSKRHIINIMKENNSEKNNAINIKWRCLRWSLNLFLYNTFRAYQAQSNIIILWLVPSSIFIGTWLKSMFSSIIKFALVTTFYREFSSKTPSFFIIIIAPSIAFNICGCKIIAQSLIKFTDWRYHERYWDKIPRWQLR